MCRSKSTPQVRSFPSRRIARCVRIWGGLILATAGLLVNLGHALAQIPGPSSSDEKLAQVSAVRVHLGDESSYPAYFREDANQSDVETTRVELEQLDTVSHGSVLETTGTAQTATQSKQELDKKIAGAHKGVYYDNDFSYLCDPAYTDHRLGDFFKRRYLVGGAWYDIGGEYRMRFHSETNMRGLGLTGVDDDFLLHRTRLYGDMHVTPNIRVYGEMIDAESNYENFGPRPIEVNRADMLNLFADARLLAGGDSSLTLRVGRQELLYGAQRTISPLDWANTRRTFEGARLIQKVGDLSVDAFWVQPMRVNAQSFDAPDRDQEFMGIYASRTDANKNTTDVYAIRYLNGSSTENFRFNTVGARNQGGIDSWLWDLEGAFQFGTNTDGTSHTAGFATFGLGRKLGGCWDPTLWLYYDWASGDDATGQGNGFHHLFPLAHKYNGFMDLFGRRNLEDVNVLFKMSPSKKLDFLVWYHYFFLETQTDTPYSVVMTPFNGANLPGSPDLGHEIDFLATYRLTDRQQFLLGYSHFFSGSYYTTTVGVPFQGDADFFYTQWSLAF